MNKTEKPMTNKVNLPIYTDELRQEMQDRLSRIEGQVRGVARMLEQDRPCMAVLQQLASVQAALKGVTKTVLRNYLERCATDAIRSGDTAVYDELMEAIYKFVK
jgi:DNA-binding FrmR family transcriptional regulator